MINSCLDSRLGVMAPMTTSKNTASCILRTYSLFTWSSLLSFFYLLKSVHKDYRLEKTLGQIFCLYT